VTVELLPGKSWPCCPVELWHRTKVGYLVGPLRIHRVAKSTTIFRRVGPSRLGSAGTAVKASLGGSKASSGSGQVAKMNTKVNLRQLRQRAGHRQHRQLTSARPCLFWIKRGLPPVIQEWVMVAEMAGKRPSATVSFPGAE